jgi:cell division protein FtsI (penicillin-binding protein 3)
VSDQTAGFESFGALLNNPGLVRDAQLRDAAQERVEQAAADWRGILRRRLAVAALGLFAWAALVEARLVYLQVVAHDDLVARAEKQRSKTVSIPGKRGEIVDRNGRVLAYSVDGDAIFAEPGLIKDADVTASRVCAAIEGCTLRDRGEMAARLRQRRAFSYLWRRASPADAARVLALDIRGLGVLREDRRYYPQRELASHVLGYVGIDGSGLGGVEAALDRRIAGRPGTMLLLTDAKQKAFGRLQQSPTAGATIELTIDTYVQYIAERELAAGVREFGARGGTVVVMEPASGDILAMANWPTFNPNVFNEVEDDQRRNRAVQEVYEPGSTFKIVTASAALEERVARPNEMFDVSRGSISFGRRTIRDVHRYGPLSLTNVIVKSSNVGAILIGQRVGADRLARYVKAFGFGEPALRALQGESAGIVWDIGSLNPSALASVSMGYQIGVTAVQMVTAAGAIANGGELIHPRLVRATIKDGVRIETPMQPGRRAVSAETAATLRTIMETVVEEGTGKAARIDGYTIAGKTGTAAKLEGGRYSKSDYNASFVGFLPSRTPTVLILVVIDSPHGKGFYGGAVAAPVFKRIADQLLRHMGIAPTIDAAPPLLVAAQRDDDASVVPTLVRTPTVLTHFADATSSAGLMPDMRGMSARLAVNTLSRLGLVARLSGDGFVVDQEIRAGAAVERGATCLVRLARRPPITSDGETEP